MEYSKLAQGLTSSTGGATPIYLPFQPDFVEFDNYTAATTPANGGVARGVWSLDMGQGTGVVYKFNATPVLTTATLSSAGISTFAGGTSMLGSPFVISGVTKSSTAPQVTTSTNHGLTTGSVVVMTGLGETATTGMQQLASIPFVVTVTGATTFTIAVNNNTASFTTIDGGATNPGVVRQVIHPALYFPGVEPIVGISQSGSTVSVTTSEPHQYVVGQQVAFFMPSQYGTSELNYLPNNSIPGQPMYFFVKAITSATIFTVTLSSTITAFTFPTVAQIQAGLAPAQVWAVGDQNLGPVPFGTANAPPILLGSTVAPMNASTIAGAFQNNTRQGFIIGASMAGTAADQLYWRAYKHDLVL